MTFFRDEFVAACGIGVGFLRVRDLELGDSRSSLEQMRAEYHAGLLAATTLNTLLKDPRLVAYQDLHRRLGKRGRQYTPAPESLFKALFKSGGIRSVHPVVDLYNLVSMQQLVSIGAHDADRIESSVALRRTGGGEMFMPLGEQTRTTVTAGEYCYFDRSGEVIGRLECRQCERTRIAADTRNTLFIIQGNPVIDAAAITAARDHLLAAISACGGRHAATEWVLLA